MNLIMRRIRAALIECRENVTMAPPRPGEPVRQAQGRLRDQTWQRRKPYSFPQMALSAFTFGARLLDRNRQGWIRFASVVLLFALFATAVPAADARKEAPAIGSAAPEFSLPDTSGRVTRLADYRGGVLVLNFWAFWCDTWKAELPDLRELGGDQDKLGFHLVAISVDGTRLSEFEDHAGGPVPFPVLLDTSSATTAAYSVKHVPTVVIIDRQGRVRYTAYGYPGNQSILTQIRRLDSEGGS